MTQSGSTAQRKLPDGWKWLPLSAIADVENGPGNASMEKLDPATERDAPEERLPLILSRDLKNEKEVRISYYTTKASVKNRKLSKKILTEKRILLAIARKETAGRVGIFQGTAIHNHAVDIIIPRILLEGTSVLVEYLFYYFQAFSPEVTEEVKNFGKPSITITHLKQLAVPVPSSLLEQRWIASRLDTMLSQIRSGRVKAQEQLTTIKQCTFPDEQEQSFRLKQMQAERDLLLANTQQCIDNFTQVEHEVLQRAFRGEL